MKKLYEKSELWFALACIAVYVVGNPLSENLSLSLGVTSCVTFAFNLLFSIALFVFISKNGLLSRYGLCKSSLEPKRLLYYIPLVLFCTHNFWRGFGVNMPFFDTLCYVGSMLCVGFAEEVLFRGLLFKAMSRDNIKAAVIVSSITFGLGHLLHLFDGSGVELVSNLCQVFSAVGVGFMFVMLFYRSGSLIPCIIAHSLYDAFSAFSNNVGMTDGYRIMSNVVLLIIDLSYALYILKTTPKATTAEQ